MAVYIAANGLPTDAIHDPMVTITPPGSPTARLPILASWHADVGSPRR